VRDYSTVLISLNRRNALIGRNNFVEATERRSGARMDEVATMPGLGGVGFNDGKEPSNGFNSPTPYVQLYCQEKVPTYAAVGNKSRGPQNLDRIPERTLPEHWREKMGILRLLLSEGISDQPCFTLRREASEEPASQPPKAKKQKTAAKSAKQPNNDQAARRWYN
jgi:hypothetical protein